MSQVSPLSIRAGRGETVNSISQIRKGRHLTGHINKPDIDKIKERGGIKKLQTSRCLRARSMTLIMDVYGISEVLVNIEDMSGRDIYETN